MSVGLPRSHIEQNEKIFADGYVDLYEFIVNTRGEIYYLRIKENNSVKWNGYEWQGIPLSFEGWKNSSLDQPCRPTFTVANPNGVFSSYIREGALINATMRRYRVLSEDIINDKAVYVRQNWRVWQVKSFTNVAVVLELRTPMDGFNVRLPRRCYESPDFPIITVR